MYIYHLNSKARGQFYWGYGCISNKSAFLCCLTALSNKNFHLHFFFRTSLFTLPGSFLSKEWNIIIWVLSAENNHTHVCIRLGERAWLCMFHSSLVFHPHVVSRSRCCSAAPKCLVCCKWAHGLYGNIQGGLWPRICWFKLSEVSLSKASPSAGAGRIVVGLRGFQVWTQSEALLGKVQFDFPWINKG